MPIHFNIVMADGHMAGRVPAESDSERRQDKHDTQANWTEVDLPHTWNGEDGQDGGNDYYRGTCFYVKTLDIETPSGTDEVYVEFEGANSSADLYVNGKAAGHHDGGYSTWRVNVTSLLQAENELVVAVDNAPNDHVYPQMADFTF